MNIVREGLMEVHRQDESKLLSAEETAEFLGTTTGTLAAWRCTKKYDLPYVKIGALVRYRKADLTAWVSRRAVNLPEVETSIGRLQGHEVIEFGD
jgi:predicted DNA-binding transcriptional regulator AlpA